MEEESREGRGRRREGGNRVGAKELGEEKEEREVGGGGGKQ